MADFSSRQDLAQAFLQEAVYQSRARQAAGAALAPDAGTPAGPTNCGLGREAAIELGLSARGTELFALLWPEPPAAGALERVQTVIRDWVARQDELDRDRNHFLKAFRQRHGFDRARYTPERLAAYEAGLAEVNERCDRDRATAARALLAAAEAAPGPDPGPARPG